MATVTPDAVVSEPRDDDFYFTLVTFEVEGILFRVPRHPLESGSEVFRDMLSLRSTGTVEEGTSDEKPLILHEASSKDFRALLTVLLDAVHIQQSDLSQEEWTSVLRLSHLWNFDRLLDLAVLKLGQFTIDPATKIVLARSHGISSWLHAAYFDLAMRTGPLTPEEANKLGMDTVLKLAKVREHRFRWIIEDGDVDISLPQSVRSPPYRAKSKKKGYIRGFEPTPVREVDHGYVERLEAAVRVALTDTFGLE